MMLLSIESKPTDQFADVSAGFLRLTSLLFSNLESEANKKFLKLFDDLEPSITHLAFAGRQRGWFSVGSTSGSCDKTKLKEFCPRLFSSGANEAVGSVELFNWSKMSHTDVGLERFVRSEDVHSSILIHVAAENQAIAVFLHRVGKTPAFSSADTARLRHWPELLRMACEIRAQVSDLKVRNAFRRSLLDHSRIGAAIVDQDAKVLLTNKSFDRLVLMANGVGVVDKSLVFDADESNAKLLQALVGFDTGHPRYFPVVRNGLPPLQAVVRPILDEDLANAFGGPGKLGFCLMLSDPRSQQGPTRDDLAQLFQLSNAEATVAAQLARGASLVEVAKKFEISIHTVRSHLRRILKKTNTRTQADLLRVLSSIP